VNLPAGRQGITEVLEYQPGELYVKKYKRIKYAKPDNGGVLIGKHTSRPIEKAMDGEGVPPLFYQPWYRYISESIS